MQQPAHQAELYALRKGLHVPMPPPPNELAAQVVGGGAEDAAAGPATPLERIGCVGGSGWVALTLNTRHATGAHQLCVGLVGAPVRWPSYVGGGTVVRRGRGATAAVEGTQEKRVVMGTPQQCKLQSSHEGWQARL